MVTAAVSKVAEYYGGAMEVIYGEAAVRDFNTLAGWVYDHPIETDVIIGSVIVGSLLWCTRGARKARKRAHRLLWGSLMKRKDREKYHKMQLEDAIVDKCMEMVHSGDMTAAEELKIYQKYAKAYDLAGLLPHRDQASVKRGVNLRLLRGWWAKIPKIPGGLPGVKVDPSYKPEFAVERRGLGSSKYLTEV